MKPRLILAVLFVVSLFFLNRSADAIQYGPISVVEIPQVRPNSEPTFHGYVEYRFRVTNQDSVAHRVALVSSTRGYDQTPYLRQSSNVIEVAPSSSAIVSLIQPPLSLEGVGVRVVIDDRYQKDLVPCNFQTGHFPRHLTHRGGGSSNEIVNVMTSQRVPPDLREQIQIGTPVSSTAAGGTTSVSSVGVSMGRGASPTSWEIQTWTADIPVEDWTTNWLGYSRFDALALTSEEMKEIQNQFADLFAAIRRYVEIGGNLVVIGTDWIPPAEWSADNASPQSFSAMFGKLYFTDKKIEVAKSEIDDIRKKLKEDSKRWHDAMGVSTASYGYSYSSSFGSSGLGMMGGEDKLITAMAVVASYSIPIRTIMVLIIVFAVLIGPVNIFILSQMKRRIWLLWTVPATSIIASAIVLGVNLVQEGLLRQSSSTTFSVLDQRRSEALTVGYIGYYSTFTPRKGMLFESETEVTPCISRGYGNARAFDVALLAGGTQHFFNGWINARVPAYFALRKPQTQRKERLTFDWSAATPTVTNGLGVDVKKLTVCSPDGEFWTASNLVGGAKVDLSKASASPVSKAESLANMRALSDRVISSGPEYIVSANLSQQLLRKGTYLAETDVLNPLVEPGVDNMQTYKHQTRIFGIFE